MSISTTDDDLGGTGTLGIRVTLNDGNTYILSNNHVLAGTNTAPIGALLQPGEGDGGGFPADLVATLTSFVPLDFGFHTVHFPPLPPYPATQRELRRRSVSTNRRRWIHRSSANCLLIQCRQS